MDLVVHCKKARYDVYIGRLPGAASIEHYGNPFTHLDYGKGQVRVASREAAVQAYEDWLAGTVWQNVAQKQRQWVLAHINELRGKTLGCWCAPLACHGDVLVRLANK